MMVIHEEDILAMTRFIARNVATKLRIQDADFKTTPELLDDIARANAGIYGYIDEFLKAYRAWFNFHKKIDQDEKAGKMSAAEQKELLQLMHRRDSTRKILVEKVNDLR